MTSIKKLFMKYDLWKWAWCSVYNEILINTKYAKKDSPGCRLWDGGLGAGSFWGSVFWKEGKKQDW